MIHSPGGTSPCGEYQTFCPIVYIKTQQNLANFSQSAAGIVMVFVVVLTIEMVSSRIRSRLRPGEADSEGLLEKLRDLFDPRKWLGLGVGKP